jgi:hypothetical protein
VKILVEAGVGGSVETQWRTVIAVSPFMAQLPP